jgi:hypothetical protein
VVELAPAPRQRHQERVPRRVQIPDHGDAIVLLYHFSLKELNEPDTTLPPLPQPG